MNDRAATLWLRVLRAAEKRGLLPVQRSRLTPRELAVEAARRGEDRLARLVDGWYYPTSFGRVRGALSDEEADRLVAELEAEIVPADISRAEIMPTVREHRQAFRLACCELCGSPLAWDVEKPRAAPSLE